MCKMNNIISELRAMQLCYILEFKDKHSFQIQRQYMYILSKFKEQAIHCLYVHNLMLICVMCSDSIVGSIVGVQTNR